MDWLRRGGHEAPSNESGVAPVARPAPQEGAAPGVAAMLKGLDAERSYATLDLGPASPESLRVHSRFARWIRFADLLGEGWPDHGVPRANPLQQDLPSFERRYDLVFAWDITDRNLGGDHTRLIAWLADNTTADARLHLLMRAAEHAIRNPLRFSLIDADRIRYEVTGDLRLPLSRLLPAELGRLLAPFHIVHAFTLKTGFREYVAQRR